MMVLWLRQRQDYILHNDMINKILDAGIIIKYLTLHISYNTFKPIIVEDFLNHDIGEEYIKIEEEYFLH